MAFELGLPTVDGLTLSVRVRSKRPAGGAKPASLRHALGEVGHSLAVFLRPTDRASQHLDLQWVKPLALTLERTKHEDDALLLVVEREPLVRPDTVACLRDGVPHERRMNRAELRLQHELGVLLEGLLDFPVGAVPVAGAVGEMGGDPRVGVSLPAVDGVVMLAVLAVSYDDRRRSLRDLVRQVDVEAAGDAAVCGGDVDDRRRRTLIAPPRGAKSPGLHRRAAYRNL